MNPKSEEELQLESTELFVQLKSGADEKLADLFQLHRAQLARIVGFRMDARLASRIDPEDLVQEVFVDAQQRLASLRQANFQKFIVWIRMIIQQTMINVSRRHIEAEKRSVNREVAFEAAGMDSQTSFCLANQIAANMTSPSLFVSRRELTQQIAQALTQLQPTDQEVIAMRHFEELSNSEVAEALQLTERTASIRYVRALAKLKKALAEFPGFFDQDGSP